jgi:stage V sporulation protein B
MRLREKLKSSLVKGALQLTFAGTITRIIGLAYRMVLSRLVGAEGLGLFQMIMPVYALLAVIAGLGLSGAVTKMVADSHARGDLARQLQVRRLALRLALATSLALSILLWVVLSVPLGFIPDHRIIFAIRLMPAAFTFAAISSVLRSFSQGRANMTPTALSQVGEQIFRVSLGLAAAFYLAPYGLAYVLVGLVAGIAAGEVACFLILYLMHQNERRHKIRSRVSLSIFKEMFALSLPILAIRLSTSITQTLESLIIPARLLVAGFSSSQATTLFGQLSGMALPLVFLPTVLIIPLNTTIVPAVAGAATLHLKERLYRLIKLSIWGSLVLGAASAALLYLFSPSLTAVLYGSTAAAPLVMRLAPAVPFAYLQFTTAAILHGMGHPGIAVANDLGGTLIGLLIIYTLTANPFWGINGVVIAYTVTFILITLADCIAIASLIRKT